MRPAVKPRGGEESGGEIGAAAMGGDDGAFRVVAVEGAKKEER